LGKTADTYASGHQQSFQNQETFISVSFPHWPVSQQEIILRFFGLFLLIYLTKISDDKIGRGSLLKVNNNVVQTYLVHRHRRQA
jgi:hypothetical protein